MSTSAFAAGALIAYDANTTSSNTAENMEGAGNVFRIANTGAVTVFVKTFISDPDAAQAVPVLANSVTFLSIPYTDLQFSAYTLTSAATIYCNRGFLTP